MASPEQYDRPGAGPASGARHVPRTRRLSVILTMLAEDERRERISIGELVDALGSRAFGALILVFAVPNLLPVTIPGMSMLLAILLTVLGWQLILGRRRPWLPEKIRRRSFRRAEFGRIVGRVVPLMNRMEHVIAPRLPSLTERNGKRAVGVFGILMAVALVLPVPFGNVLPAVALCLIALGIIARDGIAVLAGLVAGIAGAAFVIGVMIGLVEAALHLIGLSPFG